MYCNVMARQSAIIEVINNVWHNLKHKQLLHDKFRFSYMYDNQKPGLSGWSTNIWNFVIIVVMN